MGQPRGSAAAKSLAKGVRDWEPEEEQSAGGISTPLPSSWQAPGNRQARQTELAAGIYGETAIALGLPTLCCWRRACPTCAPAFSGGLEFAEKSQAVLEDVGGGGTGTGGLALGTRVRCRAPSKGTALAWICASRVVSLQNREAKTKVDGMKDKQQKLRMEMFSERHGESGYVARWVTSPPAGTALATTGPLQSKLISFP